MDFVAEWLGATANPAVVAAGDRDPRHPPARGRPRLRLDGLRRRGPGASSARPLPADADGGDRRRPTGRLAHSPAASPLGLPRRIRPSREPPSRPPALRSSAARPPSHTPSRARAPAGPEPSLPGAGRRLRLRERAMAIPTPFSGSSCHSRASASACCSAPGCTTPGPSTAISRTVPTVRLTSTSGLRRRAAPRVAGRPTTAEIPADYYDWLRRSLRTGRAVGGEQKATPSP